MTDLNDLHPSERTALATTWTQQVTSALATGAPCELARLFLPTSYWRDMFSLTWSIRTFETNSVIGERFLRFAEENGLADLRLDEGSTPSISDLGDLGGVVQFAVRFETNAGTGLGFVRLQPQEDGSFAALVLFTGLGSVHGYEEKTGRNRPAYVSASWHERNRVGSRPDHQEPEVLIIGGGHNGLGLAARLGQLDVDTLVVESTPRIGDSWRNRYQALVLHNQLYANALPYLSYPDTFPLYLPKDMYADWLELYAKALELNVWTSSQVVAASYDDLADRWTVEVQTEQGLRTLHPRCTVLAIGLSGVTPNMPTLPGSDSFRGTICHSRDFNYEGDLRPGLKAVVVGTGASGHDIAHDLWSRGADVTMLQRSSTTVTSVEAASRLTDHYRESEGKVPIDDLDLFSASIPNALSRRLAVDATREAEKEDEVLLDGLRRAGFLLDSGIDGTGWVFKALETASGYYLNAGASELIVSGDIKVASGRSIDHLTATGLVLSDGTCRDAELIVFATGYRGVEERVASLFGPKVADAVGTVWGLGADGEIRNLFRPTAQRGLVITGTGYPTMRIYSRYLALYLRAYLSGLAPWRSADDVALRAGGTADDNA